MPPWIGSYDCWEVKSPERMRQPLGAAHTVVDRLATVHSRTRRTPRSKAPDFTVDAASGVGEPVRFVRERLVVVASGRRTDSDKGASGEGCVEHRRIADR